MSVSYCLYRMATGKMTVPYQCTLCDISGDSDEVIQHHLDNHVTADKIPYACKDCHFKTFMRGKARQHREDKHGGSEHENVDDVFLGARTHVDPSLYRTLKKVNRKETFKMTDDTPTEFKSTRFWRYGDTPYRGKWYYRGAVKQQRYRSSPSLGRRRFNDYPQRSFTNFGVHVGVSGKTWSIDRQVVMDEGDHKRSSERIKNVSEPRNEASKSLRGTKRRHNGGESASSGSKSKQEEDPKKHSRKKQSDGTNVGQKPDGKGHQTKEEDEVSPCEKLKRSSPGKDQASKSSGTSKRALSEGSEKKGVNGVADEHRQKATSPPGEGNWGEQKTDDLLRSPLTTSLYNNIMEGANQEVDAEVRHEPSPNEPKPEEYARKESCASSICSLHSATSCNPTHSLVITASDGSMREVDRSKQTTHSECGSMHIIPGQRNTTEIPPIPVQFERLRIRVRNMDDNLAKTCGATQATAKGMERLLEEMRQLKSSIHDLNGAQTETNTLLKQQQLTLESIQRSCEQQLEIKKLKLHLHQAVSDTLKCMVEEFLLTMSDDGKDVYGGVDQADDNVDHECDDNGGDNQGRIPGRGGGEGEMEGAGN